MNKDDFTKKAKEIPRNVTATIPGFGEVLIRVLSPIERLAEFSEWMRPNGKLNKAREKLKNERFVCICLLDSDTSEPMFTDLQEFAELIQETPGLWNQLFPAVMRANRATEDEEARFEEKPDELPEAQNGSSD